MINVPWPKLFCKKWSEASFWWAGHQWMCCCTLPQQRKNVDNQIPTLSILIFYHVQNYNEDFRPVIWTLNETTWYNYRTICSQCMKALDCINNSHHGLWATIKCTQEPNKCKIKPSIFSCHYNKKGMVPFMLSPVTK